MAIDASQPKKVKTDGMEAEQHSLADQIAAEKHEENKAAGGNVTNVLGSMRAKLKPSGTV